MTEISDAAKLKACELANEDSPHDPFTVEQQFLPGGIWDSRMAALARFIQQVSDAAKAADAELAYHADRPTVLNARRYIAPFILADPVDDPLEDALQGFYARLGDPPSGDWDGGYNAKVIREELAARGLKIVEASK